MIESPSIYFSVFIVMAVIIVMAGTALTRYADAFAEATGLGRIWIGSIALATATSLPELATDITAIRLGSPNLAVGDLFGSTMANMLILAMIDLLPPRRGVLRQATIDQTLMAALAICLNTLAAILIFIRPSFSIAGVSPGSALIFMSYVVGMWAIYQYLSSDDRKKAEIKETQVPNYKQKTLETIVIRFLIATALIFTAAPFLAWSAKGIAEVTGLGGTFVGTLFVGLITSLPELSSCLAAIRIGAFDLAVGNLFGSNAFNIAIFLPLDMAMPESIYLSLDTNHILSALIGVMLMALGTAAIVYRAKGRRPLIEPDSFLILVTYLAGIGLLYFYTT